MAAAMASHVMHKFFAKCVVTAKIVEITSHAWGIYVQYITWIVSWGYTEEVMTLPQLEILQTIYNVQHLHWR